MTLIPHNDRVLKEDLQCSADIYARAGLDLNRPESEVKITYRDLLPQPRVINPLPQRAGVLAATPHHMLRNAHTRRQDWHVLNILLSNVPAFAKSRGCVDAPEAVLTIPVTKATQVPLTAMEINQSTTEGNATGRDQPAERTWG